MFKNWSDTHFLKKQKQKLILMLTLTLNPKMLSNRLLLNTLNRQFGVSNRLYTVIVERHEKVPIQVKGMDQRKYDLKSRHFHYKLVDCLHTKKWGNVDLVLTEYVEGKAYMSLRPGVNSL